MPAAIRRWAIHRGDSAAGSMPDSTRATKRPHRSTSSMRTDASSAASVPDVATCGSGRAKGTPKKAARSRATPAIDSASGRLASTSSSMTTSALRPSASPTGAPRGRSPLRCRMPSWSSPRPSSLAELSMPLDHSPRILRRAISMPSGITVPIVASGTRMPGSRLEAPQAICSASPSPASTSTRRMRSASGWARTSSTLATTTPSRSEPTVSIDSTDRPRLPHASAISAGSSGRSANSDIQDRTTRTSSLQCRHHARGNPTGSPQHCGWLDRST